MTEDLGKYKPRISKVMREMSPERVDERVRKALDDPELKAATEELQRARRDSASPGPMKPVVKPISTGQESKPARKGWPLWLMVVFALISIGGPIVLLLIGKSIKERPATAPSATATTPPTATATPDPPAAPTVTGAPTMTAIPTTTATSTVTATPTVTSTAGAEAPRPPRAPMPKKGEKNADSPPMVF